VKGEEPKIGRAEDPKRAWGKKVGKVKGGEPKIGRAEEPKRACGKRRGCRDKLCIPASKHPSVLTFRNAE
jgi:hypothetical protein